MDTVQFKSCRKCILDQRDDPDIYIDSNGICNHCHEYDEKARIGLIGGVEAQEKLDLIFKRIKTERRGKYDSILGVSGGVDSTYVAWIAKKHGLNPLLVHFDNGWNSELAVQNIENIVTNLGFDLITYVVDWDEFKDIQLAYFKANVVDIEAITDHAILATLYNVAKKNQIHYILSGTNITTEAILPSHWVHRKTDWLNIKDIHKQYGQKKLRTFPYLSHYRFLYFTHIYKINSVSPLNYLNYSKNEAKEIIQRELGWRDYGGKHYESIFTRFYQGFILPTKFGIDKRKAHLSSLICSGQITRENALKELSSSDYDVKKIEEDKEFVLKKLGFTEKEFSDYLNSPARSHLEFASYVKTTWKKQPLILRVLKPLYKLIRKK